jgi:hypothetical protein
VWLIVETMFSEELFGQKAQKDQTDEEEWGADG